MGKSVAKTESSGTLRGMDDQEKMQAMQTIIDTMRFCVLKLALEALAKDDPRALRDFWEEMAR